MPLRLLVFFVTMAAATTEYIRSDGVRITHDPYAPGMMEKYGKPGETDNEGFDPYRDSVGPGIYGGIVKRDANGQAKMLNNRFPQHPTLSPPCSSVGR